MGNFASFSGNFEKYFLETLVTVTTHESPCQCVQARYLFHAPSETVASVLRFVCEVWTGLKPLQYRIISTTSSLIRLRMTSGMWEEV